VPNDGIALPEDSAGAFLTQKMEEFLSKEKVIADPGNFYHCNTPLLLTCTRYLN